MSASPDLVHAMSRWLAGHISDDDLRDAVEQQRQPETDDLRRALEDGAERPELERLVRETLQDVAAG
jgi:ribosomal protein L16 Arg81 hydroxylase